MYYSVVQFYFPSLLPIRAMLSEEVFESYYHLVEFGKVNCQTFYMLFRKGLCTLLV